MLGQVNPDFGPLGDAVVFLVAAGVTLVAGSRGVTWLVDRVRDAVERPATPNDPGRKLPRIVWPLLALGFALVATLGFNGTNIIGDAVAALPKGSTALQSTAGEVITAIVLAGLASSWHDRDKAKNP